MSTIKKLALLVTIILSLILICAPITGFAAERYGDLEFIDSILIEDENGRDLSNIPVGDPSVSISESIRITYTFSLNNTYNILAGDTFTFQIPYEIYVENPGGYTLETSGGIVVATYTLATDGTIQFVFTDEFANGNLSNVSGDFWFELEFNPDNLGLGGSTPIEFEVGGTTDTTTIVIEFEDIAPPPATIEKTGALVSGSQSIIEWTIIVNEDPIRTTDASIVDVLPNSLTFIDGSVTINGIAADSDDYSIIGQTFMYNFAAVITTTQTITFRTEVTDATFSAGVEGENIGITNQSTLHHDSGLTTDSETATVNVPVNYIEKTSSYSQTDHAFTWTIWINNNSVSIPNAVFTDVLPTSPAMLTLDSSTFQVDDVDINQVDLVYDIVTNTITYTFPSAITQPTKITFVTNVGIDYYYSNQSSRFSNTATLVGTNVPNPAQSVVPPGARSEIFNKFSNQGYNASTGVITWRIRVNQNLVSIIDPVITDVIPAGLSYVGTPTIVNNTNAGSLPANGAFSYDSTTSTFEYDFDTTSTADVIDEQYTITFYTKVDDPEIYANNVFIDNWPNYATLTADGISITDWGTQDVSSNVIAKTGTNYNYATRVITWEITVNNNQYSLNNVVITDNIPNGIEYVANSFRLNGSVLATGFDYNEDTDDSSGFSGSWVYDFDDTSTTDEINTAYTITYETVVTDLSVFITSGDKVFSNDVSLTHNAVNHDIITTGTQTVTNNVLSKFGDYTAGNTFIDWTIEVNMHQILLTDAVITDRFQTGLKLDTTTVRLFYMNVAGDGTTSTGTEILGLTGANVVYDLDDNELNFYIPNPPSGTMVNGYVLTFTTTVTDKSESPFTNVASFRGTGSTESGAMSPIRVAWAGAGNSATGENGMITIQKTDATDDSRLNGAEFVLIDRYDNIIDRKITTGNGEILFDQLRYVIPYTVQETQAPTGYVTNSTPFTFSVFTSNTIIYEHENARIIGNVNFYKYDEESVGIEGALFACYNASNVQIATALSQSDGLVEFNDLEYGSYTFEELNPAVGYLDNDTVLSATIVDNGVTITTSPGFITNTMIIGQIQVEKLDGATLAVLSDAEIGLYAQSDRSFSNPVAVGLSGVDGLVLFEQIPYGSYIIREISPPAGFALSEEQISVNVIEDGVTVDAGQLLNKFDGSVSPDTGDEVGGTFTLFYISSGAFLLLILAQAVIGYKDKHSKREIKKLYT